MSSPCTQLESSPPWLTTTGESPSLGGGGAGGACPGHWRTHESTLASPHPYWTIKHPQPQLTSKNIPQMFLGKLGAGRLAKHPPG